MILKTNENFSPVRRKGFEIGKRLRLPTKKDEYWKHTNIAHYLNEELIDQIIKVVGERATAGKNQLSIDGETDKCEILKLDTLHNTGEIDWAFDSTHGARYYPDALVRSLFGNGYLLRVHGDPGDRVELAVDHFVSGGANPDFNWMIVEIDSGVELVLEEKGNISGCLFGEYDFYLRRGAGLRIFSLDSVSAGSFYRRRDVILADEASSAEASFGFIGGGNFRGDLEFIIRGERVDGDFEVAYLAPANSQMDFVTLQNHMIGYSKSNLLISGAIAGNGKADFTGTIRVDRDAQKTDAYQKSRSLLLSDNAHSGAVPRLEILANDVRCTHGASIGRLDDDILFYLQSRGIDRREAEFMASMAFLGRFLERLPKGFRKGAEDEFAENIRKSISRQPLSEK